MVTSRSVACDRIPHGPFARGLEGVPDQIEQHLVERVAVELHPRVGVERRHEVSARGVFVKAREVRDLRDDGVDALGEANAPPLGAGREGPHLLEERVHGVG